MLSRRAGESVVIADDVVITVLEVRGDVIRLGIQAPRAIQVHREEVYRDLERANEESVLSGHLDERTLGALLKSERAAPANPGPGESRRPNPGI